jgi:PEP-CTERM motif
MKEFTLALAAALLAAAPKQAQAQTMFTGAGCSGLAFTFCASWTGTYIDDKTFELFITNTSSANANNANSAFTQIGIGNLAIVDPTSINAVTGWQYDAGINGFNGLIENQFGTITTNGINNALGAGQSLTFRFNFGVNVFDGLLGATNSFQFAQIAIHDQGTPTSLRGVEGCNSSKGIMDANTSNLTPNTTPSCGGPGTYNVVPEPSTYALMASGLLGIFGVARRRRHRTA